MTPPPKEVRRSTLRKVVRAEIMANWKLRLLLACGHVVVVTSTRHGEYARCWECGAKEKPIMYEDET